MKTDKCCKQHNMRIGWILANDRSIASSRLQGHLIHEFFLDTNIDSEIMCENFELKHKKYSWKFLALIRNTIKKQFDVVIFVRPNWMAMKLSALLRQHSIKTIAVRCDHVPARYDDYFDSTIVPTTQLKHALKIKRCAVIDDMIEVPTDTFKTDYNDNGQYLNIVWVGHPGYCTFITNFFTQLEKHRELTRQIKVTTISSGGWASHEWAIDTVFDQIIACDIAVIPIPKGEKFDIKSSNRLTMLLALGIPVIATPINAYTKIADQHPGCTLAESLDEFVEAINGLTQETQRTAMGQASRQHIRKEYSQEVIAKKWATTCSALIESTQPKPDAPRLTKLLAKCLAISAGRKSNA